MVTRTVLYGRHRRIAGVTPDRPEHLGAIDDRTPRRGTRDAGRRAGEDDRVPVILLGGPPIPLAIFSDGMTRRRTPDGLAFEGRCEAVGLEAAKPERDGGVPLGPVTRRSPATCPAS